MDKLEEINKLEVAAYPAGGDGADGGVIMLSGNESYDGGWDGIGHTRVKS
jgi:beta-glucanase (GH16 family)